MFKLSIPTAIVAAALALPTPAQAADQKGNYVARGQPALMKCSEMAPLLKSGGNRLATVAAWIDGVVTGFHMALPNTLDLSPYRGGPMVMAMVIERSAKTPDQTVHTVVYQVANALAPYRVVQDSETVPITVNGKTMGIAQPTLSLIEEMLMRLGYLKFERPSGRFTEGLRAALKAFQRAQQLPQTELPDPETLLRLGDLTPRSDR